MNKPESVLTDEEETELIEQADGTELSDGEFVRLVEQAVLAKMAKQEPDCWAVLTPNGSRLVSPQEAKGLYKAYPLYTHPFPAALLEKAASMLDGYAVQFGNPAPFQGSYEGVLEIRATADALRAAIEAHKGKV